MFHGSNPIFLGTVGDRMLKSEVFTAIIGSQFGHNPHTTDYGPIVIGKLVVFDIFQSFHHFSGTEVQDPN